MLEIICNLLVPSSYIFFMYVLFPIYRMYFFCAYISIGNIYINKKLRRKRKEC